MRKVRYGLGQMRLRRTPLDFLLLLFFLALFVSLGVSYSGWLALDKFWILLSALAVYYVVTAVPRRYALWVAAICGPVAAGLAIFYVTADFWHNGLAFAGRFLSPFNRLLALRLFWPLLLPHPNVVAGHIALLLPYTAAVWLYARRDKKKQLVVVTAVCLVISLVGLLATRSVGAWLALITGLSVWALWPLSGRLAAGRLAANRPLSRRVIYGGLVAILVLVEFLAVWLAVTLNLPGGQTIAERLALAGGAWRLTQDYAWLGSGLATFPALYAEYMRVLPNFYLNYSDFYLDVLLELGPVGAICLLAIWAGSLWLVVRALHHSLSRPCPHHNSKHGDVYWLRWATLSSFVVILVHGLVDDSLFGGLGTPLLFFTPAMAVLVSRHKDKEKPLFISKRMAWVTAVLLFLLAGILVGFRQRITATWYAYRGAHAMDLALFADWPSNRWRFGDDTTLLEPARLYLDRALQLDDHNRTAHQRLGMVALWEMDIDTAVFHLQQAYAQDPTHRGVVKSLGYAYVWQGQPEKAYPLLAQIPEAAQEMEIYVSFWYQLDQPGLADKAAAATSFLKNNP
ncbi:MAG: tetratricopeptide repeat protein [Anaerolineae bacterium]|nr:tetratricopeptide repeat protein [Anaerolineae bacterium]